MFVQFVPTIGLDQAFKDFSGLRFNSELSYLNTSEFSPELFAGVIS